MRQAGGPRTQGAGARRAGGPRTQGAGARRAGGLRTQGGQARGGPEACVPFIGSVERNACSMVP